MENNNTPATALRVLYSSTAQLSQQLVSLFNSTQDEGLKSFLNDVTPDLIAVQMKLQEKARTFEN